MTCETKKIFARFLSIAFALLLVLTSYPYGAQAGGGIVATGGTITTSGGNTIHTFTSSGTFTVTSISAGNNTVNYLVVAGGGGGASGGAGGAGGFRTGTLSVTPGSYTVTVGAGGTGGAGGGGSAGATSTFATISSNGGGAGGFPIGATAGGNGGSGGSGGSVVGQGNTPSTSPSQGNNGGTGGSDEVSYRSGGGGGGAGAVGANFATVNGGNGGAGTASSISGSSVTYAGGGGGGASAGNTAGTGGAGGGGAGGVGSAVGGNGTANTGGGGGGGGTAGGILGGAGGSGIVIISYSSAGQITLTGNVKFLKNLAITGSLTKGSGTFAIDHPLDPANKILYHSFVESPDAKNIYNGIASLDKNGEAKILLPAYFDALNNNVRYQFFALNDAMPNLYIREEEKNNQFTIAGGKPNGEISWQISGIRHDPYILAHPIIIEVEKGPGQLRDKGECIFEQLCK